MRGKNIMNMNNEKNSASSDDGIIIIDANNTTEGIHSEYEHLTKKFGVKGKDWNVVKQTLGISRDEDGEKYIDLLELEFPDGTQENIAFDITSFYGKRVLCRRDLDSA